VAVADDDECGPIKGWRYAVFVPSDRHAIKACSFELGGRRHGRMSDSRNWRPYGLGVAADAHRVLLSPLDRITRRGSRA
jgi:hypothetical protein